MNISMVESFADIKENKEIDRPVIVEILTDVFKKELTRKFGDNDNFDIILNSSNGDFEIWRTKTVVFDGEVVDPNIEISISDVRKVESDFEVGEEYSEKYKISDLGRRSILNIRQNLKNKVRQNGFDKIIEKFKDLVGYMYSAEVKHIRRDMVILTDNDGNEIFLPKNKQIKGEFYKKGSIISGVIEEPYIKNGKPFIPMSRTSPDYVQILIESEVPEFDEGTIQIESVVREAGNKTKVVISTYDDRIDPVSVCVGMGGNRIKPVVFELKGETIDFIEYSNNINVFISRCLKNVKPSDIFINGDVADVYVDSNNMGKVIGRKGVNIRLTEELSEFKLNIINKSSDIEEDVNLIEFKDEIDEWIINKFIEIGLDTAKSVIDNSVEYLEKKTDLEVQTIEEVLKILKSEFE